MNLRHLGATTAVLVVGGFALVGCSPATPEPRDDPTTRPTRTAAAEPTSDAGDDDASAEPTPVATTLPPLNGDALAAVLTTAGLQDAGLTELAGASLMVELWGLDGNRAAFVRVGPRELIPAGAATEPADPIGGLPATATTDAMYGPSLDVECEGGRVVRVASLDIGPGGWEQARDVTLGSGDVARAAALAAELIDAGICTTDP